MKKEKVERIGVSLSPKLLKKFDGMIKEMGYKNRSQAIGDAIRGYILKNELKLGKGKRIAVLSLIYDHQTKAVLTEVQHKYCNAVQTTLHFHLDKDTCLELIILKGNEKKIIKIKNKLTAVSGVKYFKLLIIKAVDY